MKVVLDTNVLISGLMYPASKPGQIVQAWRKSRFDLIMSTAQLTEIARVLTYPKIRRILGWEQERIERLLKQLYLRTVMVDAQSASVDIPIRDVHDLPLLQSLIAGQGAYLVTGNGDLLALKTQYSIVTPAEFTTRL